MRPEDSGTKQCPQLLTFLQGPLLCLSISIRGCDDRHLHLPSAALTLHLFSCETAHRRDSRSQFVNIGRRVPNKSKPLQGECMEHMQDFGLSGTSALGATLLRFILAGFWIAHWWFKVGYRGMAATRVFFLQQGLPAGLVWFVISFELVIAACLVLGIYVPLVCLVSLPILFASMWIYRKNGFYFSSGGIELPILWACAQLVQALLGPGALQAPVPGWLPEIPALFDIPL
jgi:uncharacterized membrane protein YphA (DoxX/SURF4 family)